MTKESQLPAETPKRKRAVLSERMNTFLHFTPFVCAMLVVLSHSQIDHMPTDTEMFIQQLATRTIPPASLSIFFMLSGFLFFLTADSMRSVGNKLKRRLFTILIPFLVWSTLYYLVFTLGAVLLGSESVVVDFSPWGIFKGIVFYQYAYQLWFMFLLIGMIALSPVIYWILKSRVATAIAFGITAVAALLQPVFGLNLEITIKGESQVLFAWNCFVYYFLGCIAARVDYEKWIDRLIRIPYAVVIPGLVVTGVLCDLLITGRLPFFNENFGSPLVATFLVILFLKIANDHAGARSRLIGAVPTMIVYGAHPIITLVLLHLLELLPIPMLLVFFLRFVLTVVISCAVALIIKKIKPLYIILNGNR